MMPLKVEQVVMVQTQVCPPPPLNPEGGAVEWRRWKMLYEAYAVVMRLDKKRAEERMATIITVMGTAAIDIY